MDARDSSKAIERLLEPVVEDLGYELVDLQLRPEAGRLVLRLLVDRPGGITLDECARLSREVGPHLDVADLIPRRYVLEVSSPGVYRPLKRPEDFERFRGERIEVHTHELLDARKTFRGVNLGPDGGGNLLVEEGPEKQTAIPFSNVRRANLDPELKF
ncbi:MAG: ribosome maturation factor RimP [Deltaproteobacteria bacterium]|nr:ribosome maturation factor RimP [Deltaproteobacteria bacterium]